MVYIEYLKRTSHWFQRTNIASQ